MARINLLKSRQVETLPAGFHSDGSNLYLRVSNGEGRAWVFRYMLHGKVRQIGLGPTTQRKVGEARALAEKMRRALIDGEDPASLLQRRDPARMTFRAYAEELIASKRRHFKSDKHGAQWPATLERYAYPVIGAKRPSDITLADIEAILRPMWAVTPETSARVRSRIEAVLDYAFVAEGVDKRNPAAFRGNLEHRGFETRRKVAPIVHHPAAPYADMPAIMAELRGQSSTSALALRFTILTWARSSEVRGACWSEFDDALSLWTLPAIRMKANREHEVPLSDEAREIMEMMRGRRRVDSDLVFPGPRGGRLSDVGINKALHRLPTIARLDDAATLKLRANARTAAGREGFAHGATVHGMRSTARSWAAAKTDFHPFVLELALAHVNRDKVEAAYQRDSVLEKRAELMAAWGDYCRSAHILPFQRQSAR
jgi:integrase